MTLDIEKLAREAGFKERNGQIRVQHSNGSFVVIDEELERFAGLVLEAAAVEAVKQAVESVKKYADEQTWVQPYAGNRLIHLGWNSAYAIRAMKPWVKP